MSGKRSGRGRLAAGFVVFALMLACAAPSAAAPYEPNDSIASAAGPLLLGQTYDAALDTSSDRDFFYFYVTSPTAAQVSPAIRNLGGGQQPASLNATVVDPLGSPLLAFAYFLGAGGEATGTVDLEPQKYFLEVRSSVEGSGTTSYSLTPGGGPGAFGPYAEIAGRCAAGTKAVERARRRVRRAQSKLQRATARLRQSLVGTPAERETAKANHRRAKAGARAAQRQLKAKRRLLRPWCDIPQ